MGGRAGVGAGIPQGLIHPRIDVRRGQGANSGETPPVQVITKLPDPSIATDGFVLLNGCWFAVKMLVGCGGLTWNSFPLSLRTWTWEPAEPVGTPAVPPDPAAL